jgi:4-diphosphocytidyl-2-C-methyl-D-erythritol kinase
MLQRKIALLVGEGLPCDERNLAVRAANAYFAKTGKPFGVHLTIDKKIPMQAGLGGGSADAAATLKALNLLDGQRFSMAELAEIGAAVGADVPFCVFGGTALCRGIGERISPLESHTRLSLVVAISGEGVSTPAAFAALDARYGDFEIFASGEGPVVLIDALERGDAPLVAASLFNRFEEVIEPQREALTVLKNALLAQGAIAAQMSGSGPAVFGIFPDIATAKVAAEALKASGARAFACETI